MYRWKISVMGTMIIGRTATARTTERLLLMREVGSSSDHDHLKTDRVGQKGIVMI